MNKAKLEKFGELLFPLIALGFALYMLISQYYDPRIRQETFGYTVFLSVPIILCCIAAFIIFFKDIIKHIDKMSFSGKNYFKPIILLFSSFVYVFILPYLGHPIATGLLLILLLYTFEIKSIKAIICISIILPTLKYIAFIRYVELRLPLGILEGLL